MSERQVSQTTVSQHEPGRENRLRTFKATYLIWMALGLLESLIALRFLLKLMAANPENPFAMLVYNFSYIFVFPFLGLLPTPEAGGMALELSSLIAMLVYALAFWALERLVWLIFYRPREATVAVTQQSSSGQHTNA